MAVKSQVLATAATGTKPNRALEATSYAAAFAAIAIGLPLWLIGARYTLDGWVIALNWCSAFLRFGASVPVPSGWYMLLLFPIGIAYSLIERRGLPLNPQAAGWAAWTMLLVVWIVINATDVGSTYLGIVAIEPTAWPVNRWLAATWWAGGTWALVLTYLPESLMMLAWWIIRWK